MGRSWGIVGDLTSDLPATHMQLIGRDEDGRRIFRDTSTGIEIPVESYGDLATLEADLPKPAPTRAEPIPDRFNRQPLEHGGFRKNGVWHLVLTARLIHHARLLLLLQQTSCSPCYRCTCKQSQKHWPGRHCRFRRRS